MRDIKFRGWNRKEKEMQFDTNHYSLDHDIMQYTGLKDRNSVEIYEGDILEFADKNFLVIWEDYRFNLKDFYEFYLDYPTEAFSESLQFKVVGNIHEHPHLLEEERT